MFATPAFAQAAAQTGGPNDLLMNIIPFAAIFVIMYFFIMRPQQRRAKQHREMVAALRRGDTVVTSGGMIGKIARVTDDELFVDLAENVRVRVLRNSITEVRGKTEPASADADDKSDGAPRAGRKPRPAKGQRSEKTPAAEPDPAELDKPD